MRIGYAPVDFTDRAHPAARAAFDKAVADFARWALPLVETKLPEFPYGPVVMTVITAEGGSVLSR